MARRLPPKHRSASLPFLLAGGVIALFVVAGLLLVGRPAQPAVAEQPVAPHFVDTAQQGNSDSSHANTGGRTVVVARLGEPVSGISGETGPLMTTLVQGTFPEGATEATVRTDENCTPDQDGVSHCLNELDFGTTTVVVQHHHRMARTSCLTPGEVVRVETMAQYEAQF
jgi:hypothetical protein